MTNELEAPPGRLGLNGRQQRALFRLRARHTIRQFGREPGKLLMLGVILLLLGPVSVGLAVGTGLAYRELPDPWPGQALGIVLTFLWVAWMVYPLLLSGTNESLDLGRLLIYPLRRRDVAVSVLLGTLFDVLAYLVAPFLLAALVVWGSGRTLLVAAPALLLAYANMVFAGQLVLLTFGGLMQSRRVRDVTIILFSLLAGSCYFVQIYAQRFVDRLSTDVSPEQFLSLRPLDSLQWLPPGAAARAIERAAAGDWPGAMLWLGATTLWLLLVAGLWFALLQRLLTGQGFLILPAIAANDRRRRPPPAARARRDRPGWLPADVAAIMVKELRLMWRTPQRRVGLIWGALLPLLILVPLLAGTESRSILGRPFFVLALPGYAAFATWTSTTNMLGFEGKGLPALLLTPVARTRFFTGKILALSLVSIPVYLILGVALIFVAGHWAASAALAMTPGVVAVVTAVNTVASVLFPAPVQLEKTSGSNTFAIRGGCLAALGNALVVPFASVVLAAPAIGLQLLAIWRNQAWLGMAAAGLALAMGGGLLWLAVRVAARLLLGREPEVIKAIKAPDA